MRKIGGRILRGFPLSVVLALAMTGTALAAPGELDATFGGGDGIVTSDFTSAIDQAYAVAVQGDGKIVVAGGAPYSKNASFAIARYNTDGSLDVTFSGDGKVRVNLSRYYDAAWGIAVQTDGKVVAAGDYSIGSGNSGFAVLRFDESGVLDPTFGGDGKIVTQFTKHDDGVAGLALQGDGKILVSGGAASDTRHSKIAIARYDPDGTLDSSFGGDGKVTTALGDWAYANGIGVQSDGKIVAAGIAFSPGPGERFGVVRYNADGTLDATFSGDGAAITGFTGKDDAALELAIQPDDKVVVAGMAAGTTRNQKYAVARYDTDGSLDSSFGGGDGKVLLDVTTKDDYAYGVALQLDGKIVVVGETQTRWQAVILRLNVDGSIDLTFSGDGKVLLYLGKDYDTFNAVAVQADGGLVAAGAVDSRFLVVRYLA